MEVGRGGARGARSGESGPEGSGRGPGAPGEGRGELRRRRGKCYRAGRREESRGPREGGRGEGRVRRRPTAADAATADARRGKKISLCDSAAPTDTPSPWGSAPLGALSAVWGRGPHPPETRLGREVGEDSSSPPFTSEPRQLRSRPRPPAPPLPPHAPPLCSARAGPVPPGFARGPYSSPRRPTLEDGDSASAAAAVVSAAAPGVPGRRPESAPEVQRRAAALPRARGLLGAIASGRRRDDSARAV